MTNTLFWLEKAGRIHEYEVSLEDYPKINTPIDDVLLSKMKLLREVDAYEFYRDYNHYNGTHFETYVTDHDAKHMEQADEAAIAKYNNSESIDAKLVERLIDGIELTDDLIADINQANPTRSPIIDNYGNTDDSIAEKSKFLGINTKNLTSYEISDLYDRYKNGYSKSNFRELQEIYGNPE